MTGKADAVNFMYRSKYFIALALVAVLVTAQASNVYSVSSSNVATYNKWTTVNDCDYCIFTDGTTVYAKNGNTGAIDYSGSSTSSVIQSALDNLPANGKLFIKKASSYYGIDTQINIPTGAKYITIQSDYAELRRTANIDSMFNLNNISGSLVVEGVYFNGNGATLAATNRGIGGSGSNIVIQDNIFDGFNARHPVGISSSTNIKLIQNSIGDSAGFGSEGGVNGLIISDNNFFEATNDYAIMAAGNTQGNNNVLIENNLVPFGSSGAGGGIDVVAQNAIIRGNYVNNPYQHSIYVHTNVALGGSMDVKNIVISNNILNNTQSVGGKSILVQNNNTVSTANLVISNNYLDKGITLNSIKKAVVEGNILNDYIYTLKDSDVDIYNNKFYGTYAINIEPSVTFLDDARIIDNRFNTTTGTFAGNRFPTNSVIKNNEGFNPQGVASITVGASPYTYTNNDSVSEAIYIDAGTVSTIVKNGVTVFTSTGKTVWLEPGESVTVTYTGLPTMKKDRK